MNELLINQNTNIDILSKQDLSKPIQKVKYWERDYINSKLDIISNKSHKTFFMFLWRTGCRVSEAIGVRLRDVDFVNYTVTIRWLKKRKYETRIIPLHPELRNILDYYVTNLKHDDRLFNFSRQRADQISRKYFNGSCHKFRHSFAVNWLRSGGDLYLLSRMLGHSSVKVTETYLQIVPIDIGKELIKVQF